MTWFGIAVLGLVGLKCAAQLWLERVNARNVRAHAVSVPDWLQGTIDSPTYARSVEYTLAKSRFRQWELLYDSVVIVLVLFCGVLPWGLEIVKRDLGLSPWAMALFLLVTGQALSVLSLPFAWHAQFRLEDRFGFNTTKQRLWWTDRAKALLLGILLGYPLLALIVWLMRRTGSSWWLWAWGALMFFQLLMAVLAPVLILPLFNKFTPLPEGSLRERLWNLARRTSFAARSIQVMDGSKRSRHSNAFFTGFGRFRKIVLFDTLISQLIEPELEAVLAHEIGHFKKRHLLKMLVGGAAGSLACFYLLSWLARQPWFYQAFGFRPEDLAAALLLFGLLFEAVSFWFVPLIHWWSRRYEYEADAFAAGAMLDSAALIGALRKLSEKNLSNLTPHPLYSAFYYSHPTLFERERALLQVQPPPG